MGIWSRFFDKSVLLSGIDKILLIFFRGLGALVFFLSILFLTNKYDVRIVSDFEYYRTVLIFLGSIATFGFDHSILQLSGKLRSTNEFSSFKRLYLKILFLILIISVSLSLGVILIRILLNLIEDDFDLNKHIILVSIAVFFYAVNMFNSEVFRVFNNNVWAELYHGLLRYLPLLGGVYLLYIVDQTSFIFDWFIVCFIILAIIGTFHLLKKMKSFDGILKLNNRHVFGTSFPIAISTTSSFLLLSIDIFCLKYFCSKEIVAIYAQPIKILAVISLIQNAIRSSVAAKVAEFYFSNESYKVFKLIRTVNRMIGIICLPLIALLFLFAEEILSLFGDLYIQGATPLRVLIIGRLFASLFGATSMYMNMTGKQKFQQYSLIMAVVINIVLNIFLVPIYGMLGAAVASSISIISWYLFSVGVIWKKDNFLIVIR